MVVIVLLIISIILWIRFFFTQGFSGIFAIAFSYTTLVELFGAGWALIIFIIFSGFLLYYGWWEPKQQQKRLRELQEQIDSLNLKK